MQLLLQRQRMTCLFCLMTFLPVLLVAQNVNSISSEEAKLLRQEIKRLRERVELLEAQAAKPPVSKPVKADVASAAELSEVSDMRKSESPAEMVKEGSVDEPTLDIKGALRFNVFWETGNDAVKDRRGDSAFDLFRIGAEAKYKEILLSAEYRFYSFMDTLHHGWVGWEPNGLDRIEAGITKVPFGLLPYASHNFWFGVPYYLGLSDDYDIGVKYVRQDGPWDLQLAFFKNEEFSSPGNLERYSFDVVSSGDQRNEETNQGNLRIAYTTGKGTDFINEYGLSGQFGGLRNQVTGDIGNFRAYAVHWNSYFHRWNFQIQTGRQNYNPRNPVGVSDETVLLGAFATSYEVASEATFLVANVAYNFPVPFDFLDSFTGYNDFSVFVKDKDHFNHSFLNTTGLAIGSGPIFIYLDFIQSRNMVFFDGGSLAGGGNDEWNLRMNLNLGYYW